MNALGIKNRPSTVQQVADTEVAAWYGIRFATLLQRFQPAQATTDYMQASTLEQVPVFPQLASRLSTFMGGSLINPMAEDAFYLNIWAPVGAQQLPILFFIHGGAWMTGGGAQPWYDGAHLAAQGMVVITVNYRLGALGHLGQAADCELPLPADDVLLALQWVIEHAEQFGGNTQRLTVAGQSAGGWYAHLLSVLKQTKGLLHKVALLSMGTRTPWSAALQQKITQRVAQQLGNIQTAPVEQLLQAGVQALDPPTEGLGYAPSAFLPVASAQVPEHLFQPEWAAQSCHAQAVYIRYTADESAAFFFNQPAYLQATQEHVDAALSTWSIPDLPSALVKDQCFAGAATGLSPYLQLVAASSWRQFQRFPTEYLQQLSTASKPVVFSRFQMASPLPHLHSAHCFDLPFQFGVRSFWADAPMLQGVSAYAYAQQSQLLVQELSDFVCK